MSMSPKPYLRNTVLRLALAVPFVAGCRTPPLDEPPRSALADAAITHDLSSPPKPDLSLGPDLAPGCSAGPGSKLNCFELFNKKLVYDPVKPESEERRMDFDKFSIVLEDSPDPNSVIISIIDKKCNTLRQDKIENGVTKDFTLMIGGEETHFKLTIGGLGPGTTLGSFWAIVQVSDFTCCMPAGQCGMMKITIATLSEGESSTINFDGNSVELTTKVIAIDEKVGAPMGQSCPISLEQVKLEISQKENGKTTVLTGISTMDVCLNTIDSCVTVYVGEIMLDVKAPMNGTCAIANERVRVIIITPE
ncbi:hypothetical protein HY988_03250 [Candidatus Micrarchaeota archaeon]|nr:hypothetical protein [Candidatus Micrarchaeota archaeon]